MPTPPSAAGLATTSAAEAIRLANVDPGRARAMAMESLRVARRDHDAGVVSMSERALGLAAREDYDIVAAVRHLRRAIGVAERAGLPGHAAQARVNLAGVLALRGDLAAALREADRAAGGLRGRDRTVLEAQRAFLLHVQGRLPEALAGYRRVLPAFRRTGDHYREATALNNRGLVYLHLGALAAAEADLVRSEALFTQLGHERAAVDIWENLGSILVRRGKLAAALAWFDRADEYFRARGEVDPVGLRDRCEALISAQLVAEARATAERAVRELARRRMGAFLAEARLHLAEAAMMDGDAAAAREAAEQARRAFARHGLSSLRARAHYARLQVAWQQGERSAALLHAARRTARELADAGWLVWAADAHLVAARLAIERGRLDVARGELDRVGRARRRGPVELRWRAWYAVALLRLADGNRRGAASALRAGIRLLGTYRAALGATELRVSVANHVADLAHLGLRLALEDRNARRALAWAERWRAGALQLRPGQPADGGAVAAALAELRRVGSQAREAAREGRDASRMLARQVALEESIARRTRHAAGDPDEADPNRLPSVDALVAALRERVLVEVAELDGQLWAVVLADGRARLWRLGSLKSVTDELGNLAFALRRLAYGGRPPASRAAARQSLAHSAQRLDQLLLGCLRPGLADRPLVIVPTGPLHALPWATLPSCAGRSVQVAPSAALWLKAARSASRPGRPTVLVAGPGPPQAANEVRELAATYPDGRILQGSDARVQAVTAAMDGAHLAHVAAHGRFRADNPLFSSLELVDGPLTVYDLEGLRQAPTLLVLSACDSGLSAVRPGDELMGLAAAVFALGTRTLIASVVPISDAATRPLMLALHQGLRAGLAPAAALARAQLQATGDEESLAASTSFVCLGTG
jgi:tetratricopeptide (TPR) repeat protein